MCVRWDPSLVEWDPNDFRIFVGDMGSEVNDEILSRAFSHYSSFVKGKMVRNKQTNKNKGAPRRGAVLSWPQRGARSGAMASSSARVPLSSQQHSALRSDRSSNGQINRRSDQQACETGASQSTAVASRTEHVAHRSEGAIRTLMFAGYGFVSFSDAIEGARALREMNGKYVGNRPCKLSKSTWDVSALRPARCTACPGEPQKRCSRP